MTYHKKSMSWPEFHIRDLIFFCNRILKVFVHINGVAKISLGYFLG